MLPRKMPFAAILFAVNAYVVWRVFGLEWSEHMDSIEGAYIAISRHILTSFPDLSWWPAWYGGIPFVNSYPPLLHYLVTLFTFISHVSIPRAHHIVTGLFYCLGPVFAYLLLKRLSANPVASFCAALLYTVLTPSALLVKAIALDLGHPLRPRRLQTLIGYGDGPHLAALALVPLAIYALDVALERRSPLRYGAAAFAMAAVVCTNWLGGFALAALILCYLIAGRPWRDWLITAAIGLAAYLAVSPLMPPSLIRTIQFNAQTIGGDFRESPRILLHYAPYAIGALAFLKLALWQMRAPQYLQMLALFTAITGWISLGYSWYGVAVVPQPDRYLLEFDLGLTLALAMSLPLLTIRLAKPAMVLLLLFSVAQAYRGHRYARGLIKPVEISTTVESRFATWCDAHLHGARVMVPGSVSFFFNGFTETPQLAGGFENGVINYPDRIAQYQILHGMGATPLNDAPLSILWLKAFGVQAVAAGGKQTRERYHAFENGAKFQGVIPELFRDGDDAIYKIPLRTSSLAHVMTKAQLCLHTPINGVDVAEVRRYVEAIDDPSLPDAQFLWHTAHSAEVLADLAPGQIVQVQESYHPGWRATVNGASAALLPDGLGFFAIVPDCTGRCRIELVYDGGNEQRIARGASALVLLCWLGWVIASTWQRRVRYTGFSETSNGSSQR